MYVIGGGAHNFGQVFLDDAPDPVPVGGYALRGGENLRHTDLVLDK